MALEISRPETDREAADAARVREADARALEALASLLGGDSPAVDAGMTTVTDEDGDDIVDIRDGAEDTDMPWVSVAEAAKRADVSTSTVRQWYRSGRLATQRREGERGGFLVPIDDVLRLASAADDMGDVAEDSVIDINASYWAAETEAARAGEAAARAEADEARSDARRLSADLDDAREQIEAAREQLRQARLDASAAERAKAEVEREVHFLRTQLSEANDELREIRARAAGLEASLEEAKRAATFGSVTNTEWVDGVERGYRGPLRAQDPMGTSTDDYDYDHAAADGVPQYVDGDEVAGELLMPEIAPIVYGEAADDLLPDDVPAPKRRRR